MVVFKLYTSRGILYTTAGNESQAVAFIKNKYGTDTEIFHVKEFGRCPAEIENEGEEDD